MSTYPALPAGERVLPPWLKSLFLATFIVVACWGSAIVYWRTTKANPTTGELLLYLLGLPACLVLVGFIGQKLIPRPAAAPAATAVPTPAKASAAPSQTRPLAILAASLRLPHGASPEELASAIADNKARADLDKELVDEDGFPIMAARCKYALDETLRDEMGEWLALNGMTGLQFNDEQWRALTLASAVVAELAAQAAGPILYQVDTQAKLQLIPLLPAEWGAAQGRAAGMWLKQTVARYGWPGDDVIVMTEHSVLADDVSPSTVINQLAQSAGAESAPLIAMVVAFASYIADESVERWAANGSLFTSSQPHGHIPGEGAVGLLMTDRLSLAESSTIAVLDGVEEAYLDSSADETKRVDSSLLRELSERAFQRSGIDASNVAMVVADTGQRPSRVLELLALKAAGLSRLCETDDVVRVGVASGTCGTVPFFAALALGRYFVLERGAPVLCVGNDDPYRRMVVLVRSSEFPS